MDEHIDSRITRELRRREVDVLTAQEDGYTRTPDVKILDDLELIAKVADHSYFKGRGIEYLPY